MVVDATALTDYLLGRPDVRDRVDDRMVAAGEWLLYAPELVELETLSAVRALVLRGELSERRASEAVDDLAAVPLIRYPHGPLRERVWQLRHQLTAYDAAYLALAEGLNASLMTADGGLAARARDSLGASRVLHFA